jgi:hypothetical protein
MKALTLKIYIQIQSFKYLFSIFVENKILLN